MTATNDICSLTQADRPSNSAIPSQNLETNEQAKRILESLTDAFFALDWEWRFIYANAQAGRILNRDPKEFLGKVIWEEYPGLTGSVFEPIYRTAMVNRIAGSITSFYPDHNCWYEVRLYPSPDGVSVYFRDVSDLKRAENSLREARDAAETANRAKDKFLAVLSHELRTPLSPVVMAIPSIESDPELPGKFREDLAMIRRNIDLEVKLIDDLLDLSRVTSGKLRLQMQPVGAHEILRHAIRNGTSDMAGKCINIHQELLAANDRLSADPARLQQVFWNLLRNAVKFTPDGGDITIRTMNSPDNSRLSVEVIDTGVGIPPETLPRIFEAFEQGDLRMTRQFGGLGLGLAIARAVVEMHGGTIAAASDGPNKGATFTVQFNVAVDAKKETEATPHGETAGLRESVRIKVLLVEDHPDTARMLSRLLTRSGHEVTTAHSVTSALQLAGSQPFDLMVSDIGLPDATGYELMEQIRDRHGIKGIALTGYGMEEDIRKSRESGFADHVVKPIDIAQLEGVMRRVVNGNAAEA